MIMFRVDANEYIATGHMMRCITIAEKLMLKGEKVLFCLAEKKHTDILEKKEIAYKILSSSWNDLLTDIKKMEELIFNYKPKMLIVDSYYATKDYLERLNKCVKVFYLDDMLKQAYDIDTVWNANEFNKGLCNELYFEKKTKVLSGFKYALIRDEFYPSTINKENNDYRVLITTGGTDKYNVSSKIIKKIQNSDLKGEIIIDVIIGKMNENKNCLLEMKNKYDKIVHLYENIDNMGELIRKSDCVITAGGNTMLEVCACQVPAICFSFVENQYYPVKKFGEIGIMLSAGDARFGVDEVVDNIVNGIKVLKEDKKLCSEIKNKMYMYIDGKGCDRVVEYIVNNKYEL